MANIHQIANILRHPVAYIHEGISSGRLPLIGIFSYKRFIDNIFLQKFGHRVNWNNPADYNEKIQWLKIYGDTKLWSECTDKYKVRQFVKDRGCGAILVSLYGNWKKPGDINWEDDSLPDQYVLKMNNGSGDVIICTDKKTLSIKDVSNHFNKLMAIKYGTLYGEPHYNRIKPCIIAEQYLDCTRQCVQSSSLIDYKFFCFNGKPFFIWTCLNRSHERVEVGCYDLDWNFHEEWSVDDGHYKVSQTRIPKPANLKQMLSYAEKLSAGFHQVRVDLYEVDNKVYFGEMTFTSMGGYVKCFSKDFLKELGNQICVKSPLL